MRLLGLEVFWRYPPVSRANNSSCLLARRREGPGVAVELGVHTNQLGVHIGVAAAASRKRFLPRRSVGALFLLVLLVWVAESVQADLIFLLYLVNQRLDSVTNQRAALCPQCLTHVGRFRDTS